MFGVFYKFSPLFLKLTNFPFYVWKISKYLKSITFLVKSNEITIITNAIQSWQISAWIGARFVVDCIWVCHGLHGGFTMDCTWVCGGFRFLPCCMCFCRGYWLGLVVSGCSGFGLVWWQCWLGLVVVVLGLGCRWVVEKEKWRDRIRERNYYYYYTHKKKNLSLIMICLVILDWFVFHLCISEKMRKRRMKTFEMPENEL